MKQSFLLLPAALLLYACGGCARTPASAVSTGPMLNITMTVSGQISSSDYYYVIFNNAEDATGQAGPEPVIAPPWGNGFVAGTATHFVEYNGTLGGDGYEVYKFVPGSNLLQYNAIGAPSEDSPVGAGSNTLQFQIPLSQIENSGQAVNAISYLQVNMIATNRIPVNPDDTSPKDFDALGNSLPGSGQLNDYITINTQTSGTYSDAVLNNEPTGDEEQTNGSGGYSPINDPAVDISGWTITVSQ